MDIKTEDLLRAVDGKAGSAPETSTSVTSVSTDTRTIEPGAAFFALKGERFDGHAFLKEAVDKGARHVVVSDAKAVTAELKKRAQVVIVADTLTAYGDLAKWWRQRFKVPAMAVTGSSGKTTVKELTAHVLSQRFKVLKNRGTENNLVGVPKTLLQLDETHEAIVIEVGTNRPGEIARLASIVQPQIAAVTLIGASHLEGLGSIEGVKAEKLSILQHVERGGLVLLNVHDPNLKDVKSGVHKILRVGLSKEADLLAEQVWCHEKGTTFYVGRYRHEETDKKLVETPLIGRHNALNCLFAIAAAGALGLEFAEIQKALSTTKAVPGRLNLKDIAGIHFLDDTYNSNPSSFRAALDTLKEFKIRERKGIVCGDMLELGSSAEELHRQAGAAIAELLFDYVIAAGPLSAHLVDEALKRGFHKSKIRHVKDSAEAGKALREIAQAGDLVLVKGSRGMAMEKVFECFTTSSIR